MRVSEYIYKGWYFFPLKFVYSMPPPAPAFHSPPGILLNSSENTTPVSADTVEYAKKLIDELTSSSGRPSKALAVYPQVPNYGADLMPRKLSSQDLFGDTDTDVVSDTDWENKKCGSSDGGNSSDAREAEECYSDSNPTASEEGESSCSDFESTSSYEKKKMKKRTSQPVSTRKTPTSATSKQAAAGRKKAHQTMRARASEGSPQSVYMKEKPNTSKQQMKQKPMAKKRKATSSPSATESSSTHSSSSEDSSGSVSNKKGQVPRGKKAAPKKTQGSKNAPAKEVDPGKRPQKGPKHSVMRVEGEFEGDMRAGIPLVDSRPGKKRTRAGRKRKETRPGRGRKSGKDANQKLIDQFEILPPKEAQLRPSQEQLQGMRITQELDGITEDPMLPEEILVPLVVNELADTGFIAADLLEMLTLTLFLIHLFHQLLCLKEHQDQTYRVSSICTL